MAKLEIPMKVEIELNEGDRKLLQRFVDAVEAIQPPTLEVTQPSLSEEEMRESKERWRGLTAFYVGDRP